MKRKTVDCPAASLHPTAVSSELGRACYLPRMGNEPVVVYRAQGDLEEQQVRTFLEVHGIPTAVRGEALRKTHGFILDGLGEVAVEVPAEHAEHARELLALVERGEMALDEDSSPE